METRLQQKLKICTGHDWREITKSYVDFRLRNNKSRPQMCVFTPDDITKQRARLFIPEDAHSHELHRPDVFLEKYLNTKQALVNSMPWVQFDLNDFDALPSLKGGGPFLNGLYTYEIKLSGTVKVRKSKSKNNTTLNVASLKSLSANSSQAIGTFLATLKGKFNYETQQFSFGASVLDKDGVISLTMNSPNSWTGSIAPSVTTHTVIFHGWEIQTQLGYEVTVTGYPNDSDSIAAPVTAQMPNHNHLIHDLEIAGEVIGGIAAIGLMIFFAPEILAIAGTIGAVAGTAFMTNNLQRI